MRRAEDQRWPACALAQGATRRSIAASPESSSRSASPPRPAGPEAPEAKAPGPERRGTFGPPGRSWHSGPRVVRGAGDRRL
eukprot:15446231-Alexandrium_andersonii.AAC.1